ncbi:glycosyltransferase [Paracoccus gahaiensis]|uniref:glycosyltransferase n=1 Tax=Paracoccus gahaiensis TaxID=1706839 RepID=UPI001FE68AB5|nr:glycosyltransferase [Paracoccus gahaiensis]
MRLLRIAVMAHCRHPISPPFMGGMEVHAHHLAHALQARGHKVTLVAAGDSRVGVPVLPLMRQHYDSAYPWHDFHGTKVLNDHLDLSHAEALARLRDEGFDIVHNNTLHRYPPRLARSVGLPMVTSLHVPPFDALARAVRDSVAPWHPVTGCSRRHLDAYWPGGVARDAHVVPNGIDPADWPFSATGNGEAVWAGRITPNKGTHLAIAAALRAGIPLTIFGSIEDSGYYEALVRPALGPRIRHGGHLAGSDLAGEYGRASVLLFTPQWDEPFGLSAIEAMACGTPVAAIEMGAVREVVGDAGAYAKADGSDLDRALQEALTIPRARARRRVERLFTLERMIEGYEALYAGALAARDPGHDPVRFPEIELPQRLVAAWDRSDLSQAI